MAGYDSLIEPTIRLLHLVIPEAVAWAFVKKQGNGFTLRHLRVEGHPNLRPIVNTFSIAIVLILIALFSVSIVELIIGIQLREWMLSLGWKLPALTLAMLSFVVLGVYNYMLEKKWDKISWYILAFMGLCIGVLVFL